MQQWKTIGASVMGTAHAEKGLPCQDFHLVGTVELGGETVFIGALSDGAGSAVRSADAARLVCAQFHRSIQEILLSKASTDVFGASDMDVAWHQTRLALKDYATSESIPMSDLACTFLTVVVFHNRLYAAQIGDGAIVLGEDNAYAAVTWPQQGEFANSTFFLTGDDWVSHRVSVTINRPVGVICLFSDGLQQLILKYADQTVERRFLSPLVDAIRNQVPLDSLEQGLLEFLNSERVNARTDDDKSIFISVLGC